MVKARSVRSRFGLLWTKPLLGYSKKGEPVRSELEWRGRFAAGAASASTGAGREAPTVDEDISGAVSRCLTTARTSCTVYSSASCSFGFLRVPNGNGGKRSRRLCSRRLLRAESCKRTGEAFARLPVPPTADFGRNGWTRRVDLQKLASPSGQKCENGDFNPGTTVRKSHTLSHKHAGVPGR